MGVVRVATCQFPVSAGIGANLRHITRQIQSARQRGAHVAHFPEGALSGYAGTDFESLAGFDWDELARATSQVLECARDTGLWVILGSAHRLTGANKPHNSLYVINGAGQIVDRYDKRFCSGQDGQSGDLAHYSPGGHCSVWAINGVRCGALICYDYRFPELYREYKRSGVEIMFHSFHAANASAARMAAIADAIGPELAPLNRAATHTYPGITMPAVMTAQAAVNHMWISCPNSSAPQSCWPACGPGGRRHGRPAAAQPSRRAGDGHGHRSGAVRLHGRVAGPGHGRRAAQRHPGQRPALGRPHHALAHSTAGLPAAGLSRGVAGPSDTLERATVSSIGVSERPGPPRRPGL
jgi:predicted amidohydrolase